MVATSVQDESVISAPARKRQSVACNRVAPGSMPLADYVRSGYDTMPGGLATSWLQTHVVGHNSPSVLRLLALANGYVPLDASANSCLDLCVYDANLYVAFLR